MKHTLIKSSTGIILPLVVVMTFVLTSCKKKEEETPKPSPDTQKPVLRTSAKDTTLIAGRAFSFTVRITDDRAVKQIKTEIHSAADGHTHGKTSVKPFFFSKISNVSGTDATESYTINIPADAAAGPYHLIIRGTDAAGNEANFIERELYIENSSMPKFQNMKVNGVAADNVAEFEAEFRAGVESLSFSITGLIEDDNGLKKLKMHLKQDKSHSHGKRSGDAHIWEHEQNLTGKTFNLNQNVLIPKNKVAHDKGYKLTISVEDAAASQGSTTGNIATYEILFHVKIK